MQCVIFVVINAPSVRFSSQKQILKEDITATKTGRGTGRGRGEEVGLQKLNLAHVARESEVPFTGCGLLADVSFSR